VLEVRQTIQDVLQNQNRTEAVGEARAERGEKYTAMRQEIDQLLTRHFATERNIRREDVPTVAALVANEILGLGPIEPLWLDPRITEIMVNGPEQVFVEMAGKLYFVQGAQFRDQRHLIDVAQQILGAINRVIDFAHPLEDGRLSDGSRINITHPAVGPGGPYLTIRRFPDTTFTIRELIDRNSMTEEMAVQIANLVASGCSTVVVGGTGSGKTSFLNAISGCIPRDERIITIEDNLELQLHPKAHVVAMEARRSNREDGAGSVSIRQLVRNALRQRPDRIVVGEVRDASAYDMLQAMNTGHDGSLTTVHANDALGGINRLVNLMGEADIETNRALSLIAGGVDMLVVIDRFPEDGSRRVVSVEEIPSRVNFENGEGHLEPITLFEYRQTGIEQVDGRDKVVGEYVKVNDISPDMIRKHRLDRKDVLDIEQVYKLSDHN
jgi:pilus assembly protein CpaF